MQRRRRNRHRKHDLASQSETLPGQPFTFLLLLVEIHLLADPRLTNVSVQDQALPTTTTGERRQPVPDLVKYPHGPVVDRLRMAHVRKHLDWPRFHAADGHEDSAANTFGEKPVLDPALVRVFPVRLP